MAEETKNISLEQPIEKPTEQPIVEDEKEKIVKIIENTHEVKKEEPRQGRFNRGNRGQSRGRRPSDKKQEKPEFEQKLLDIRRTARMVAGGRRFSFRALVIIGNRNGKVGVGLAKGADVTIAVEKAVNQAKKYLIDVPITENKSISQMIEAKFGAAKVMLKPAPKGRGIIAGGAVRTICSLVGIENVVSKIIGRTTNKLNNAEATIEALKKLS
ncbi:MAG: 30S ribosomal protein S5 [Nanoarchaeota archaeon]|nr:30S ribosomal protein S5 [Nanoarchaeota archaeon]